MDNNKRRTRFERRVSLERDFLAPVNKAFGSTAPLAGMTKAAIDSWHESAKVTHPTVDVSLIARILLEASARCELLADNSKDVFEPDERPQPDSVEQLCAVLKEALQRTFSESVGR